MVHNTMELWQHVFHSYTHTQICTVGRMYQSPQCDQLAVHSRELMDSMLNGVCVFVCVIEPLLISYGCLQLKSIAVSLHKVVLTACAI